MSTYNVTWSYRKKVTTESVEATSPGVAVVKLVRAVASRINARRQSIEILKVQPAPKEREGDHRSRVLTHQERIAAELKALAESPRRPPRRVTP
jgi:ribosomal protein L20A (L18A)